MGSESAESGEGIEGDCLIDIPVIVGNIVIIIVVPIVVTIIIVIVTIIILSVIISSIMMCKVTVQWTRKSTLTL